MWLVWGRFCVLLAVLMTTFGVTDVAAVAGQSGPANTTLKSANGGLFTLQNVLAQYEKWQVAIVKEFEAAAAHPGLEAGSAGGRPSVSLVPAAMEELVMNKGYPLETHWVTTSDGYILTLHRIPHGRSRHRDRGPKPVVVLQHGMTLASSCFVALRASESMGFFLADAGFDVWMPNMRGNTFSRNHTRLNPDTDWPFWYYSLDEQALIDLPAHIDYVLAHTGAFKLGLVGYSQGTTLIEMLLSERTEYNDKVAVAVQLGPLTAIKYMMPFSIKLGISLHFPQLLQKVLRVGAVITTDFMSPLSLGICQWWPLDEACMVILPNINGGPSLFMTPDDLLHALHTWPNGISTRNLEHWAQMSRHDGNRLQHYDYGKQCRKVRMPFLESCNMEKYGQDTAPAYNLTRISAPHVFFEGWLDIVSTADDVAWQKQQFAPGALVAEVQLEQFAHLDYIWDRNARYKVDLTEVLLRYAPYTISTR